MKIFMEVTHALYECQIKIKSVFLQIFESKEPDVEELKWQTTETGGES